MLIDEPLLKLLKRCQILLDSADETFWSHKLQSAQELLARNTAAGKREILQWYGGMGSFSDLTLSQLNGHKVAPEDEGARNGDLLTLRSAIYLAARSNTETEQ